MILITEAMEGYLGVKGYLQNNYREKRYFYKKLKGYEILKGTGRIFRDISIQVLVI